MKDAAELAAQGAPHGTAVVAECQSAGIGRHGHTWHSEPDGGLYLSIVLRLREPTPSVTMALGLAVQRAVNDLAGVAADLRWPNDVMLNERKLAGILVQASDKGVLIAGIGLNVNQTVFPKELRDLATSLRIETGTAQDLDTILDRVVAESLRHVRMETPEILRRFEEHSSYARGKAVVVEGGIRGVTAGLDGNGFLKVQTEIGLETITAGGVRPA
jgi:BirA family biotin operon repressor/biotin-[acetyl-CoA-carboxylase] ligase